MSFRISRLILAGRRTPNPDSLLFNLHTQVLPPKAPPLEFTDKYDTFKSPLVTSLFRIYGVKSILLNGRAVTVTKQKDLDWSSIEPNVELVLDQFAQTEMAVLSKKFHDEIWANHQEPTADEEISMQDLPISDRISLLIDERVRPYVQQDGGDIEFLDFDEETGKVTVRMQGACSGCPKSEVTLKLGIEKMLKHYVPEIKEVENLA